jgi:hypothetical protein
VHRRVSHWGAGFFTGASEAIKNKSAAGYVGMTTGRVFGGVVHFGNTVRIDLRQCRLRAKPKFQMLVSDLDWDQSERAARLPRGYRAALATPLQIELGRSQPTFLTQNLHQPAGLTSPSINVQAFGGWNREQLLHC